LTRGARAGARVDADEKEIEIEADELLAVALPTLRSITWTATLHRPHLPNQA